ncbi:type VI secretion system ImpA family N-terminal domain-containing protein [uncultured Roseobacter sp.]|uniref:type VI secretion system protein TssA n=1 Tax=uncultured Roseobacter sp. TaxID=114847 RepID=UPI0026306494|nr:type VI secretion system ImpA family N-terminal domain-containing protein [uncultured Roseobacter sp.]
MTGDRSNSYYTTTTYNFTKDLGENPRTDSRIQAIYRKLRDSRSRARAEERAQETPNEEGDIIMSVPLAWTDVRRDAMTILCEHALDVEVAVWLVEAVTRTEYYKGVSEVTASITAMIEAHGAALHPQPEEPDDDTFEALGGLNGVGRDGTLVQPFRLLPLVPGQPYGSCTLWQVETETDAGAIRAEMTAVGETAMREHLAQVIAARDAFVALDGALTDLRGRDAPPFARLIDLLDDTARTVQRLSNLGQQVEEASAASSPAGQVAAPAVRAGLERIETREDALQALSEVAAFFRRTEPHSPMSHTLETLVRRGRMDFMALLAELIPDESARESVLTTAGIKRAEDGLDSAD